MLTDRIYANDTPPKENNKTVQLLGKKRQTPRNGVLSLDPSAG